MSSVSSGSNPTVSATPALVILGAPFAGTRIELDGHPCVVGRTDAADIILPDRQISKQHALLVVDAAGVSVEDLASTNGTYRNGRRLEPHEPERLDNGDHVHFGDLECLVEIPELGRTGPIGTAAPLDVRPAVRARTVLVAHDPADRNEAELVVRHLQRAGHLVWIDRSSRGDGWSGRLLDTIWSCDAIVFLVSAAADSARVRREVHLAGSERTPVIPFVLESCGLGEDLAWYVEQNEPVDARDDRDVALAHLLDRLDMLAPKRIVRPRRLAGLVVGCTAAAAVLAFAGQAVLR